MKINGKGCTKWGYILLNIYCSQRSEMISKIMINAQSESVIWKDAWNDHLTQNPYKQLNTKLTLWDCKVSSSCCLLYNIKFHIFLAY